MNRSTEESQSKHKTGSIVNLDFKDKNTLYSAYMPFVENGGLFITSNKAFELGDEVFVVLSLLDDPDEIPIPAKVVWITPLDAETKRKPGIGVQFKDDGMARTKIETILAGALKSDRQTDTM